ncbi:coordinator of PRMT5 and differentiation stimulator isoform X2 [Pseudopipra pipra]
MAGAVDATNCEEEQLPNKRETMIWKPRKECLLDNISNMPDSKSEESEASDASHSEGDDSVSPDDWYKVHFYLDEEEDEVSSIPDSPQLQSASEHEVEDWDKELEESAYGPYGEHPGLASPAEGLLWQCCFGKENKTRICHRRAQIVTESRKADPTLHPSDYPHLSSAKMIISFCILSASDMQRPNCTAWCPLGRDSCLKAFHILPVTEDYIWKDGKATREAHGAKAVSISSLLQVNSFTSRAVVFVSLVNRI